MEHAYPWIAGFFALLALWGLFRFMAWVIRVLLIVLFIGSLGYGVVHSKALLAQWSLHRSVAPSKTNPHREVPMAKKKKTSVLR